MEKQQNIGAVHPAGPQTQSSTALSQLLSTTGLTVEVDIDATVRKSHAALASVPSDAIGRQGWNHAMDERLRRLAIKISPTISVEQASEWRVVMVEALADLPALTALTAAKRAMHHPMRFMNEVESKIREIAAEIISEHRGVLNRMVRLQQQLLEPPAAITAADPDVFSDEEILKMSDYIIKLGVTVGPITNGRLSELGITAQETEGTVSLGKRAA